MGRTGIIAAPGPMTVSLLADVFGLVGEERERFCDAVPDRRVTVAAPSDVSPPAPAQLR